MVVCVLDDPRHGHVSRGAAPAVVHPASPTLHTLQTSTHSEAAQVADNVQQQQRRQQDAAFLVWCLVSSAILLRLQAYYIFSIGNIKPLLKAEYPSCYKDFKTCGKTLTQVCSCA